MAPLKTVLAFDIEADNLLPGLSQCWCIGIADVTNPQDVQSYSDHTDTLPSIQEALDRLLASDRMVAHNGIGYDVPALQKLYNVDLGYQKQWDTMTMAALLNPKLRSLKLSVFGAAMGFPKGEYDDWEGGYTDEMRVYMERDVTITAMLYNKQIEQFGKWASQGADMTDAIRIEHGTQKVLAQQSRHGFRLDLPAAEKLDSELVSEKEQLEVSLQDEFKPRFIPNRAEWCFTARQWKRKNTPKNLLPEPFVPKGNNKKHGYVAGAPLTKIKYELFNPSSRGQIAQRLSQLYGWIPTDFTANGTVEVNEAMLKDLNHKYAAAAKISRYLRLSKQVGMISEGKNAWLRLHQDGRLHGYVRSSGTRTHRMTHAHPNLAQVDKESRMRALFLPNEGHVLVGVDASALELRLMAAYLYPVDGGSYAESVLYGDDALGTDVHSLNRDSVGMHSRTNVKTLFYAYLYGAGDENLGNQMINDAEEAGKPKLRGTAISIGMKARQRLESGIEGLDRLIAYAKSQAVSRGFLVLPDGRPVETSPRTALNALLQGAGAVLMKQAAVIFDSELTVDRGLVGHFDYCANVHDELQLSVEPEHAQSVGEAMCDAIAMAGERLGMKVPFTGNAMVGANWSQTH